MRLFKLITSLIILGLVGVFVYQNLAIWQQPESLKYNLYLINKSFNVKIYILVLVPLLTGFFLGLTVLLKFHFKTRRRLKLERKEKQQAQASAPRKPTVDEAGVASVSAQESEAGKEG